MLMQVAKTSSCSEWVAKLFGFVVPEEAYYSEMVEGDSWC